MHRREMLLAGVGIGSCLAGCTGSETATNTHTDSSGNESTTDDPVDDDPVDTRPGQPDRASTLDDFEDLSLWSSYGGTLIADESTYYTGSQAARLSIRPSDERGAISRTFDEPIDLAGQSLSMALRTTATVYPRIQLFDADRNRLDFRAPVYADVPIQLYPFGIEHDGGCDLSAVTEIRIVHYTGGGDSLSIWCDELSSVPRPETPAVLFQFDDGSVTDYTQARPILAEHGYSASSFVNPATIGESSVLNLEQLSELHDSGWTICSHAYRHDSLDELERDAQEARIRDAKEWLTAHGFADGAEYFAYPYSNYDATTLELVAEYHQLGFAAGWPATGPVPNRLLAPRNGDLEPAAASRVLDLAARHSGVVTLLFHSMWDFEDAGYHVDTFESIVDEVAKRERKGDLEVLSVSEFDDRLVKPTLPAPYV